MKRIAIAALLMIICSGSHAMRCSGEIVQEGTTAMEVLDYCGEPDYIDRGGWAGDAQIYFYKQDDGMAYRLLIKQGVVYSISFGRGL